MFLISNRSKIERNYKKMVIILNSNFFRRVYLLFSSIYQKKIFRPLRNKQILTNNNNIPENYIKNG